MRLELSSEGRYALRALIYLTRSGEQVTADRISAEANVPRRLLARVLARVSRPGLVKSHEGRSGGSRLGRPPEQITLREAVETAEGPFEITNCILEQRACGEGRPCAMHEAWEEGRKPSSSTWREPDPLRLRLDHGPGDADRRDRIVTAGPTNSVRNPESPCDNLPS